MPNRNLSEDVARSEKLSRVSIEAELTFLHLISVADDYGRFDGRIGILLVSLFPTRLGTVNEDSLAGWLAELENVGLIRWYESSGRRYVSIPTWLDHQRARSSKPKYPEPPPLAASCREPPRLAASSVSVSVSATGRPAAAPRSAASGRGHGPAPESLSREQWSRLETLLQESRPWLLDERSIDLSPHCCVGWVRGQVEETLSYWRGRSDAKARKSTRGWVDTVLNRIQSEDLKRWERAQKEPPIADIIREHATFAPLTPPGLRGVA